MESGPPTVPPYVAGPLRLLPFRAVSLSPRRVGDPASARAFARPYRGVPQRLETWCRRGLATRSDVPAVYLHEYTDSGMTVSGLVGCLDVSHDADDPHLGRVFPHEGVHPRQVTDLANRMDEMRVNPAPILLVHHGPASVRQMVQEVGSRRPDHEYTDHAGQQHRVWAVTEPAHLAVVDAGMADTHLLVADGHHRYAAYVSLYRRDPSPPHRTGLAMVVDQDATPMFVGPIHRLLHTTPLRDLTRAARALGADVLPIDGDRAVAALAPDTAVLTDGQSWATVRMEVPSGTAMVQLMEGLFDHLARRPSRITFAHSVTQALAQTKPGRVSAALLPAADLDLVLSLAEAGELLPEKATSFQPKPSLGSFIRLLDE